MELVINESAGLGGDLLPVELVERKGMGRVSRVKAGPHGFTQL